MAFTFLDTAHLTDGEVTLRLTRTVEGDDARGWVPAYHFAICRADGTPVGGCDLRIGYNRNLYYGGHIGYHVDPIHRGHHYAAKACRLLLPLAKAHGMRYLYISCNPNNVASYKTCEAAGGRLMLITPLPEHNDMRQLGELHKRIYRFELD